MLVHLGAMLVHLGAMLAHLGATRNGKNGKSTKHRKTRGFLVVRGGGGRSAARAAAPLF